MYNYGYDYSYGYDSYDSVANVGERILLGGVFIWIIGIAAAVFNIICMWKLFTKAGKKGWASLVPIYNIIVMIEIAELPMWYLALFLVPLANVYAMFKIYIEIAHKFGKSTGFGVGMVFLSIVFIPMLAFGKSEYKSINSNNSNNDINPNIQNNQQINVPNNNFISNVMDVNSEINTQSVNDVNMQNNANTFQPIGNVNNNVQNMDVNNISSTAGIPLSSINGMENSVNVQSMQFNNAGLNVNQNGINNVNRICPNCGNQVDYNAMYCTNCGKNLQ